MQSFPSGSKGAQAGSEILRGCLFCRASKETKVVRRIEMWYPTLHAIAPVKLRNRRVNGQLIEERAVLLPGYVFFETLENELPDRLTRLEDVLRLLTYPDGGWQLRGYDDQFARMLFRENGEIGFSQAVYDEGDRIHIIGGFLKDYNGSITRVNRRARTVEVSIDFQGKRVTMWLGFELVEKAAGEGEKEPTP